MRSLASRMTGSLLNASWLSLVLLGALAGPVGAQEPQIFDKASDGAFTGLGFVTDDPLWYEQFRRPETPSITGVEAFLPGQTGVIAVLFSNAKAENGLVRVECEITAFEPDGSERAFPPGPCYEGPAQPDNTLYPSLLDLRFTIEEDDQVGVAGFEIILRDLTSDRSVELNLSFMQGAAE